MINRFGTVKSLPFAMSFVQRNRRERVCHVSTPLLPTDLSVPTLDI